MGMTLGMGGGRVKRSGLGVDSEAGQAAAGSPSGRRRKIGQGVESKIS
jgi:hypothetical protein